MGRKLLLWTLTATLLELLRLAFEAELDATLARTLLATGVPVACSAIGACRSGNGAVFWERGVEVQTGFELPKLDDAVHAFLSQLGTEDVTWECWIGCGSPELGICAGVPGIIANVYAAGKTAHVS